jgi:molecular chaperone Hsp33
MNDKETLRALTASDIVVPFQLERARISGRLARLGPSVDTVLSAHAYPGLVSHVLGEALALAALLGTALKFDAVFTVQAQGDGPLSLLVAYSAAGGALGGAAWRGYPSSDPGGRAALPPPPTPAGSKDA